MLDYGCGKLRYTIPLAEKGCNVVAVDSIEQIDKIQNVNDIKTSVRKYVNNYIQNVKVYSLEDTEWINSRYKFIVCCNVLSAIPVYKERIKIFKNIKKVLDDNGRALISIQYRNSYFNKYIERKDCRRYYDGWIIESNNNPAFYGLIGLEKMIYYAKKVGLKVEKSYKKDGSAYLILKKY